MGAYISLSSEIGGRALIGAWALKERNMVFRFHSHAWPIRPWDSFGAFMSCLLDLVIYVGGKQQRSCREGLFLAPGKPLVNSVVINFLNHSKRKNSHRNIFMTKSSRKNVPDMGG